MGLYIPIKVKKECCRLKQEGLSTKQVYETYYTKQMNEPCGLNTFRGLLNRWIKRIYPDDTTLECGTYEGFTAHDATVQVSKSGEIVQAWIKQRVDEFDLNNFLTTIQENVEPYEYSPKYDEHSDRMRYALGNIVHG